MSKDLEQWAHAETDASLKHTTAVTDYITPGLLVVSSAGSCISLAPNTIRNPFHFPPYPYNPAKSIYDRMRVWACFDYTGGGALALQYNLNSGVGAWTSLALGGGMPYANCGSPHVFAGAPAATTGWQDIDLSAIAASVWIGLRFYDSAGAPDDVTWTVQAMLYRLSDTPF